MNPSGVPQSGLPQSVVERLERERERIEGGAFSSALGVPEMLLARQSGYQVLGQVMGATVYQFGGQREFANWRDYNWRDADAPGWRFELTAYSHALSGAYTLALQRLQAEASALGAQGIVGVKARFTKPQRLEGDQIEFTLTGTAVRGGPAATGPERSQVPSETPFTSNLSGEETWKLERVGLVPCAFVLANCALLQTLSGATRAFIMGAPSPGGINYEFAEYTQAVYVARETAMERLENAACGCGATGILGVQIELEDHLKVDPQLPGANTDTPHQILSLIAQGTAVRAAGQERANRIVTVRDLL